MESPLGSLANEMKKKVKETVKSEFLLRLLLPTIISWRLFFRFWFLVLALAATCAFYLRFVYCLPMIDERISFQVLVFCRLPVCMDASWAHIQFGVE